MLPRWIKAPSWRTRERTGPRFPRYRAPQATGPAKCTLKNCPCCWSSRQHDSLTPSRFWLTVARVTIAFGSFVFFWAFPTLSCGSGYMDGYAVRSFTRSCRNASFSAQHSFCMLFWGQSASLTLAARLPEPSPAGGSCPQGVTIPNAAGGAPAPPRNTGHGLLGHAL